MSMNIKDPAVHAMARELAAHKGTTVTDAVRQALKAELARVGSASTSQAAEQREQQLMELLPRFRHLPWPEGVSSRELQDALYDDNGLPL
ncbi:antitoxin VapB-like family protein [Synechococcus sp. RS9909]|nr:type II toxin-antitoxin system VapB family antitoxin [Synechococcus sp. RS9917]QNI78116.1 antitoxin VapB-like family protein [Synechococcus sp. RS9909]